MNNSILRHFISLLLASMCTLPTLATAEDVFNNTACWEQTFSDDFDELSLWQASTDEGRWKTAYIWDRSVIINSELQYYIDPVMHKISPFSTDDGILTITASHTPAALASEVANSEYISGLLTTQKSFSQRYGRFEMRARVPGGRGLWPAFWMLPTFEQWPEGIAILPEIDIMEFIGSDLRTYHTTVHTNQSGELKSYPYDHNELADLSADFHQYAIIWDAEHISWYLDGKLMVTHPTAKDLHTPMHFLLNLAVGGNWAGKPDNKTHFPAEYQIDYVRAYNKRDNC